MAASPSSAGQHEAWRSFNAGNPKRPVAVTLRFFRGGLVALVLIVGGVGFAAELPPLTVIPEIASKASLTEKSSPPSPQTAAATSIRPVSLITAGLFGFSLSLVYLVTRLSKYWGLRVLRNGWSIGFLVSGTIFSVLSSPFFSKVMGSQGVASLASLQSLGDVGSSLGASVVGSGFVSIVQRLFGKSRSVRGNLPTDSVRAKPKGFLFDRIGESLDAQINLQIGQFSEQLDWKGIDTMTKKVIIVAQTTEGITEEQGKKVLQGIEQLRKANAADQQQDNLNKYEALNLALRCVSFITLRREYRKTLPRTP